LKEIGLGGHAEGIPHAGWEIEIAGAIEIGAVLIDG